MHCASTGRSLFRGAFYLHYSQNSFSRVHSNNRGLIQVLVTARGSVFMHNYLDWQCRHLEVIRQRLLKGRICSQRAQTARLNRQDTNPSKGPELSRRRR